MNPLRAVATLLNLHAPRPKVPDRWLGDQDRPMTRRESDCAEPVTEPCWKGGILSDYSGAFSKAELRCPMGKEKTPGGETPRGPMHHRRTVGLDIPCQAARLQSLTPLLQA